MQNKIILRFFQKQSQQFSFSSTVQRPVHIIGFPFAGGQQKAGPELSPPWLLEQKWIKDYESKGGLSTEMVKVTNGKCNQERDLDIVLGHRKGERNWFNVYHSNLRLEEATANSLRKKQFPIVFGGDHSQGIGSINGLKAVHKNAKILWIDAHIDVNTTESTLTGDIHGGPVAYLAGQVKYEHPPVLSLKDIIYFGLRQWEPEEMQLVEKERIPWYESKNCLPERLPQMKKDIEDYFFKGGVKTPYWISFDIDGIDMKDFASTGTPEGKGITVEFMLKFFDLFVPEALGLDLTEVNFLLTQGEQTEKDKRTLKVILDHVISLVHNKEPNTIVKEAMNKIN